MKAAYIERTGPPDVIHYGDLPRTEPGPGQALVRVEAVAVNPIDTYIRGGLIPAPLPTPYIIGCDLAGVVEAVGAGVHALRAGDRVWGSNQGLFGRQGTFAEYASVGAEWLYPLPDGVEPQTAAAVALVGITAHLGLFRDARLRAGETLFVHGGSGGVGSMVVQMARLAGARVITTAGNEKKAEICRQLGAERVILYKHEDTAEAVRAFAAEGVDVWWETLREPDFERIVPLLHRRGRVVIMAGRDARPPLPIGPFYTRDARILGFAMFNATPEEQRACAEELNRWLGEGRLQARIDRVLPLAQAAEAHRLQEESTIRQTGALAGKLVLVP